MGDVGRETLFVMNRAGFYNQWLVSFFDAYLKGEMLEIGCGIGSFTRILKEKSKLTAVDKNRNYVKKLKRKFRNADIGFGDIEKGKYFFKNITFDTIICLNVLEHVENDIQALKNMHSLLKKSGNLILLVPAHKFLFCEYDKKLGHFRRYSVNSITDKLQESSFDVSKARYLNWLGVVGWLIFMKLLKVEKLPKDEVLFFDKISTTFLFIEKLVRLPFGLSVLTVSKKI